MATKAESAWSWKRVSRAEPCSICGKPDFCTVSADGTVAHCQRVESDKPARGALGGWIHKTGNEPIMATALPKREEKQPVIDWDRLSRKLSIGAVTLELADKLGVSDEALKMLEIGYGFDSFGDRMAFWSFPMRTAQLRVTGIVRRYRDGSKKTMKWSRSGLYIVRDWWKSDGPILLPEGGSDMAAILTMHLCAIGRPSNLGGVNMLLAALQGHRNRPIIVLAERDEKPDRRGIKKHCPADCGGCLFCWPGKAGAIKTAEALSKALKRKVEWRFCGAAKDARQWLIDNGNKPGEFLKALTTK